METYVMNLKEEKLFNNLMARSSAWAGEHQLEVGLAEMAAGAGLLALGVKTGAIEMGVDLITHTFGEGSQLPTVLGTASASAGSVAGAVIGSIGVTAMGGAFGVPAIALAGGAAAILGTSMYGAGHIIQDLMGPTFDPAVFAGGASLAAVGIALLVDGARRVLKDHRVLKALSSFKDGVLRLFEVTQRKVESILDQLIPADVPTAARDTAIAALGGIAGTAVGSGAAAASVTVFGSQALGGAALSLGLVSAPVIPVVVGAAAGAGLFYASWKGVQSIWK